MIGHDHNHVPTLRERISDSKCDSKCERPRGSGLQAARIIRRAQRGDAAAFESIYRIYSRRVYALCLRMIGNPAEAEDLTQEVFFKAYVNINSFEGTFCICRAVNSSSPCVYGTR